MEEIVGLTQELIRFRTVAGNSAEIDRCIRFIEDFFVEHQIEYTRLDHEGVPSLLALPRSNYAPVLLMSHIDVIDAPDRLFEPEIRDGLLYGRGSIDDKYAAALSMVLFKEHLTKLRRRNKGQSHLPFGILITSDEEIGGRNGAKKAIEGLEIDFGIVLDGGQVDKIVVKQKGLLQLRLVAEGKSAHGARPWLGENAIEALIRDYTKVKELFNVTAPEHWHRTINFGTISAGKAANLVPDRAEALLDIRYTEQDDAQDLIDKIKLAVRGRIIVESVGPIFKGGDSPYLDLLLKIADQTEVGVEHGASDARHLQEKGVQGVVWGADGDLSQHTSEEHVHLESIGILYHYLDEFMRRAVAGN